MSNGIDQCLDPVQREVCIGIEFILVLGLKDGDGKLAIYLFGDMHGIDAKISSTFSEAIEGRLDIKVEQGLDTQVDEAEGLQAGIVIDAKILACQLPDFVLNARKPLIDYRCVDIHIAP